MQMPFKFVSLLEYNTIVNKIYKSIVNEISFHTLCKKRFGYACYTSLSICLPLCLHP